eukprot:CAMPEP_0183335878 /NCGR_PEP_ID=MMETSP0164_2-20130417/4030_1 /TAXON_ID=221442 /ORGANISM="Coccolithus pelagicus ssp braarudi, Strain PLY182g" /LENGTH=76 /DNA_ID=CAMNT_0025505305 /DNA_START=352 /DNA_END=578 /DNA_ORIENTATION=+
MRGPSATSALTPTPTLTSIVLGLSLTTFAVNLDRDETASVHPDGPRNQPRGSADEREQEEGRVVVEGVLQAARGRG